MKNQNPNKPSKDAKNSNHHANPSRMNPEVAAMVSKEQNHKNSEKSKEHNITEDKRAESRVIHTNGSTSSDRL